jgi:hypothetical protein
MVGAKVQGNIFHGGYGAHGWRRPLPKPVESGQRLVHHDAANGREGNHRLYIGPAQGQAVAIDPIFQCERNPGAIEQAGQQRKAGNQHKDQDEFEQIDRAPHCPDQQQQVDQHDPECGDERLPARWEGGWLKDHSR